MKQCRPSLKIYSAHIYRQIFGNSLSLKPIMEKNGECWAVLKTTAYKLIWIIGCTTAIILTLVQGMRFGLLPLIALSALYIIITPIRYFFARFVELDSDFVSYHMCENASHDTRPSFSAYLYYAFIPRRFRLLSLIEETDRCQYYRNGRRYYPETAFFYVVGFSASRVGEVMGVGLPIIILLTSGVLYLLLSPLSLYFWRFEIANEQDTSLLYEGDTSSTVLYKVICGISLAAAVMLVFSVLFIDRGLSESEALSVEKPITINEAYDSAISYTLERCEGAELTGFYIEFPGTKALQSGEPSYYSLIFQDAPDLLPKPNTTLSFYSYQDDEDIRVYYQKFETIRPAVNPKLVTDLPEILAILQNELGLTLTPGDCFIRISPVDRSVFRVQNGDECQVEIQCGSDDTQNYIVNIVDKTVRLG